MPTVSRSRKSHHHKLCFQETWRVKLFAVDNLINNKQVARDLLKWCKTWMKWNYLLFTIVTIWMLTREKKVKGGIRLFYHESEKYICINLLTARCVIFTKQRSHGICKVVIRTYTVMKSYSVIIWWLKGNEMRAVWE